MLFSLHILYWGMVLNHTQYKLYTDNFVDIEAGVAAIPTIHSSLSRQAAAVSMSHSSLSRQAAAVEEDTKETWSSARAFLTSSRLVKKARGTGRKVFLRKQ